MSQAEGEYRDRYEDIHDAPPPNAGRPANAGTVAVVWLFLALAIGLILVVVHFVSNAKKKRKRR